MCDNDTSDTDPLFPICKVEELSDGIVCGECDRLVCDDCIRWYGKNSHDGNWFCDQCIEIDNETF